MDQNQPLNGQPNTQVQVNASAPVTPTNAQGAVVPPPNVVNTTAKTVAKVGAVLGVAASAISVTKSATGLFSKLFKK